MIQFDAKILGHGPHLLLNLILHPTAARAEKLPHLGEPKHHVAAKENKLEHHVAAPVAHLFSPGQVGTLDERPRCPRPGDLDAIDRRAEELVVALHDAQVASEEDELLGPFGLVAEDVSDALSHLLLHLKVSLRLLRFRQFRDALARAVVTTRVGTQQCCRGKDVHVVDAPRLDNVFEGAIVKRQQRLPEQGILMAEFGFHLDVEAVVDQNKFGLAIGFAPDKNVPWMRVAMHSTKK